MRKIVFLGDSITDADHCYDKEGLGNGYVRMIAENLKEKEECEIWNKGHNGFTVYSMWRFLEQDCLAKDPDIVTILIGSNDVAVQMNTGKTLEEQEFQKTYEKILGKIKRHTKAKIICMGPFIFPYPREYEHWIPATKQAEKMALEAARKYGALFLPLQELLLKEGENAGYENVTIDGVHLTEKGAGIIAREWLDKAI